MASTVNSAVRLLDEAAEKYSTKVGVTDTVTELTFGRLRELALRAGTRLINEGGRGAPVIVWLDRGVACIVSFMAAMYSGSPYVPAAADIPLQRLEKIIANLEPGFILTDAAKAEKLAGVDIAGAKVLMYDDIIGSEADEALVYSRLERVVDTDPIYIMYTSGSTGTPKGVTVCHRGVVDYVRWTSDTFGLTSEDVLANQAPFYFDNSIFDIYGCLITGAKLIIIPESFFAYQNLLPEFLRDNHVTTIFWVPTVMINVANSHELERVELPELRRVLFCGEVMPNLQLNIWRRALPDCLYANLYGPTEITDVCACYIVDREFEDHEPLPIGRACKNMRLVILDENNNEAAPGEKGELCVIGSGVALGYWNEPELTERVFVQNPLNTSYNEWLYRTGDIAYVGADGLIMYCGRKDFQIKIKGNRVELGEIEAAAMCLENVNNVCAVFDGEKIVLFLESKEDFKLRTVNKELLKYIPRYMLPSALRITEKLPHTANDKIDRKALGAMLREEGLG